MLNRQLRQEVRTLTRKQTEERFDEIDEYYGRFLSPTDQHVQELAGALNEHGRALARQAQAQGRKLDPSVKNAHSAPQALRWMWGVYTPKEFYDQDQWKTTYETMQRLRGNVQGLVDDSRLTRKGFERAYQEEVGRRASRTLGISRDEFRSLRDALKAKGFITYEGKFEKPFRAFDEKTRGFFVKKLYRVNSPVDERKTEYFIRHRNRGIAKQKVLTSSEIRSMQEHIDRQESKYQWVERVLCRMSLGETASYRLSVGDYFSNDY